MTDKPPFEPNFILFNKTETLVCYCGEHRTDEIGYGHTYHFEFTLIIDDKGVDTLARLSRSSEEFQACFMDAKGWFPLLYMTPPAELDVDDTFNSWMDGRYKGDIRLYVANPPGVLDSVPLRFPAMLESVLRAQQEHAHQAALLALMC